MSSMLRYARKTRRLCSLACPSLVKTLSAFLLHAEVLAVKLPSTADCWGWQIRQSAAVGFACANTRRRQPGCYALPQSDGSGRGKALADL